MCGLVLLSVAGCGKADSLPIPLKGSFVPFAMCMADVPANRQVETVKRMGFHGLGLAGMDAAKIAEFARLPEVRSGEFRIPSVLWYFPVLDTIRVPWLDSILEDAHRMDMAIWMVASAQGRRDGSVRSRAVEQFAAVAERCRAKGARLVVYPHAGTLIETAEEGLWMLDSLRRLGYPEVRTSIHLCHELKMGNRSRLPEIVAKVAPFLALASVSGADKFTNLRGSEWVTAIKPLDEGSYDARIFLRALSQAGYSGPIELHTYGLKSPESPQYDRHLERSLAKWKAWVVQPSP
ncbi:MAG: sugar phosphate isomerase/epimerase [Fibrobacterota bacterium]|nr:sugar phosphate isomerase/epimerase [Fibrobacterota bacterium]QQS03262.1 MAG: sugar phosphate isomerase/epimerase [Fibrobacterota bacterium]